MWIRFFILGLVLALQGPAFANDLEPRLSNYILSSSEFFELTLEQKVVYMKFHLNFMASIEDMQNLPAESDEARLIHKPNLFDLIVERAYAAGWKSRLQGQPCLNGLNPSSWIVDEASGRVICQAVVTEDCGGGLVSCGEAITSFVPSLGKVCIERHPPGKRPGKTARCVDKIAEMSGVNLDSQLQSQALKYRDPAERAKYAARADQLKSALDQFQNQVIGQSNIKTYCKSTTGKSLQQEECAKFSQLNDAFSIATQSTTDPYVGLTYKESTEVKASLEQIRVKPTRRPGSGRPAPPPSPVQDSSSSNSSLPQSLPLPEESVPVPTARAGAKSTPRASKGASKANTGNCEQRHHAKLGALSCLACGLESVSGAEVSRKGVENWLSLLGVSAQSYYGPYNGRDPGARRALQKQVMEMVASYGYCTDDQYNINPPPHSGRDWIDGIRSAPKENNFRTNADEREFVTTYGLGSPRSSSMAFASQIFDDSNSRTGWEKGNVQERQWRFRSKLAAHAKAYKSGPFARCAKQIEDKLAHSANFNMCPIKMGKWPNGALKKIYPAFISNKEIAGNNKVYGAMAHACGLSTRREMPTRQCDSVCWGTSSVYPNRFSDLAKCDPTGVGILSQFQAHPPEYPGKPGEPARWRKSSYGGDHEGSTSFSNRFGGGGGSNGGPSSGGGSHTGGGGGSGKGGEGSHSSR